MPAEKFASLTANLLMRKGEAKPSTLVPSEPIAFPRASERALSQRAGNRAQARTAAPQLRSPILAPIGVDARSGGGVTLTIATAAESFRHHEEAQGWIGDCGSFLEGPDDLFSDPTGWQIAIALEHGGDPLVEIHHRGTRMQVSFGVFGVSKES